ncbi:hypothetical protein Lbir_1540 [Legionella birminghamensis]|uniref:Uncharacterized protein n=1 Tax=Legionella birminghamensis TaxID=28083 RepID=A0A378IB67_9GAMM|nr:hypothetical protein [Legionella birminghamensis]KTC71685.1 hypothetical protein Lbir_1540 [Legionella birminghamensis]STX32477.1 Uncharacterised protein [Legionella birminghamensis]
MKKSFLDIYFRNARGVLRISFDIELWKYAWPVCIVLLPFTLSLGAGIKTLIDFFSRKNIPETNLKAVDNHIATLDSDINPLLETINTYSSHAKSLSSQKLCTSLNKIEIEADSDLAKDINRKKQILQYEQLGIDKDPSLLDRYRKRFIANLKLDESRQKRLDDYNTQQTRHHITKRNNNMKAIIREYVSAPHNYGKAMQQTICNHFFPSERPTIGLESPVEKKQVLP